jgi:type III pantothenate kinase
MTTTPQRDYSLLIDIGNTFVKWGLFRNAATGGARENRLESGHALQEEVAGLTASFAKFRTPRQIVISNVAGTRMRGVVTRMIEVWPDAPAAHWIIPQAEQCGVVNRYRNPAQLGSDRWAALIGARNLLPARNTLVVVCGTATTVDLLSANGEFRGGFILPGVGLMLRSLHEGTAALPDAEGEYSDFPQQTVDAIVSGCQHAQAGAVERIYHMHAGRDEDLTCLVSGGAARALVPRLTIPCQLHDNLVLEGLYCISQSLPPAS